VPGGENSPSLLLSVNQGHHLWAERYDRPLQDIFALQDEIVQKIVTTLRLQLTLWEQGHLVRKTTTNLEAYDYYLRGVECFYRSTQETTAQARQLYEQALALDPQYAGAYAWLGFTYYLNPRVSISQTVSAPVDRLQTARPLGSDTGRRSSRNSDGRYERSCPQGLTGDGEWS
jgi:tetratricopeptide (TPR) repeat protein